MDIGIVSSRYSRALLKYATEKGEADEVYHGMMMLGESFERVSSLRPALENPVLSDDKKFNLLNVAAGETSSESLKQFFHLVLKNHRIGMIQFMAHSYINSYRKLNNLVHSRLTVPVKINESTINRLKDLVKQKTQNNVEFVVNVDPSIIGGFILEYEDYSYDASIRNRLKLIQRKLLKNDRFLASDNG